MRPPRSSSSRRRARPEAPAASPHRRIRSRPPRRRTAAARAKLERRAGLIARPALLRGFGPISDLNLTPPCRTPRDCSMRSSQKALAGNDRLYGEAGNDLLSAGPL
ncbi:MAG: hypothetical protein H0X57_16630 [Rubrobacter sp.]|nr:hypothetical protein [Rubrobacter sp.]